MTPYLNGLLFGLIFIFSIGPAFFSLIQTSVQMGFFKAVLLAVGISMSDICFVVLSLMGIASWLEKSEFKMWLAIVGAIVLISYGLYTWFKKPKVYKNKLEEKQDITYLKYIVKGFFLNGFNPFIFIFWMGIIGVVTVNFEYEVGQQVYFFSGVLTTIFGMDILKAFVANRVRSVITPASILIMNRSISVILILFGLHLFYFLISNYA